VKSLLNVTVTMRAHIRVKHARVINAHVHT